MLINEERVRLNLNQDDKGKHVESNLWYLDNGASNHMTGEYSKFDKLDESIVGQVKFGDGSVVQIKGKGSITLRCKNGEDRKLKEVYYIPSLRSNIISLGQLAEEGYNVMIRGEFLWVRDLQGNLLMKVKRFMNRLYKMIIYSGDAKCLIARCENENWLWHSRLGHVNFKAMKLMSSTNMVHGMPAINQPDEICTGCLMSKQIRKMFPNQSKFSATIPLELVHGDLCGPITPCTPGVTNYREENANNNFEEGTPSFQEAKVADESTDSDQILSSSTSPQNSETEESGDISDHSEPNLSVTNSSSEDEQPMKFKTLSEIYDSTEPVELEDDELYLMGIDEPTNFFKKQKETSGRRLLLALAAKENWEVHHLDVKTAFLNGEINEEVFVKQPEGYVKRGREHLVYKLLKALYGLRQAPRAWYSKLNKCLEGLGFVRCAYEQTVYTRHVGKEVLIVGVYVDDLLVTGSNTVQIKEFKEQMAKSFDMSDMGKLTYYLGIEVSKEILNKDEEGMPVDSTNFKSMIGGLRYLVQTRPDLPYSAGIVSRFMERPTLMHQNAVKRILRYVKGTMDLGLVYTKDEKNNVVIGYSDSDLQEMWRTGKENGFLVLVLLVIYVPRYGMMYKLKLFYRIFSASIESQRELVSDFFAPSAKRRWCFSQCKNRPKQAAPFAQVGAIKFYLGRGSVNCKQKPGWGY
ncbi:uncharacterized protein LOC141704579, partial [Apium graveolens]|uniref:uncharacterized protein LOC141704579 n=1 Tax=Apium graveolens TaxID=4045 RepID=UPI003D78C5AB